MCYVVHQRVLRVAIKAYLSSVTSHIPNKMMRHTSSTHDVKYMTESHTIKMAVWCARCAVYSTTSNCLSCSKLCVYLIFIRKKSLPGSVYFIM